MSQQSTPETTRRSTAQLWLCQQNINKSLVTQGDLLHQLDPGIYDMVAVQEPYLDHNYNTHTIPHWYTVYPKEYYIVSEKMRSITLVNKHIATDHGHRLTFSLWM